MVDFRHMDLVWDRPTKLFSFIGRFLRQNKDISHSREAVPVEKDGELGRLVHQMFKTSYHSRPNMSYAATFVKGYDLQLVKANNGKQSAVYGNLWRIDLGSMSQDIVRTFDKTELSFASPELDGEREVAEAFIWVGYDRFASDNYDFLKSTNFPDSDQPDLRLKGDDLTLIMEVAKVEGAELQAKYLSRESSPYENISNLRLKDTLGLPITFIDRFRNQDGWTQFGPYSLIEINGQPAAVRESVLKVLATCSNEAGEGMRAGDLEPLDAGLEYKISSQHLAYCQSVPQPAWGLFECCPK